MAGPRTRRVEPRRDSIGTEHAAPKPHCINDMDGPPFHLMTQATACRMSNVPARSDVVEVTMHLIVW